LDKTETTIVAAALETIDKIGPTDAKITVREVEDVRGSKRDYIMERAKQLLSGIKGGALESQEIGQELRESARTMKVISYGDEGLAAGDLSGNEIIVVEGRADVMNMLKHNITNVVGMNGTRLPAEIAKLGETKELTLFVDGDRGGKLIATNVCSNAKIAYIAQAPDGKEVEELAGKELHLAIRKKVTPEEFFKKFERAEEPRRFERSERSYDNRERFSSYGRRDEPTQDAPKSKSEKVLSADDKKKLKDLSSEVRGRNVLVLDEKLNVLRNVPVSKLAYLRLEESVWVLLTSLAANDVIEGAQKLGARYVAAQSFGRIDNANGVEIVSI
jgi:DNA primase